MDKQNVVYLGGSVGGHQTLDFASGHDLTVHKIEPRIGLCADNTEPAWDSLSSFSASPLRPYARTLSLKIN